MRTLFVTAITFSVALTPLACIWGVSAHPCGEWVDEAACSHEEICEDDPCSAQVLRPEPPARGVRTDSAPVGGHSSRPGDLTPARAELLVHGRFLGQRLAEYHSFGRNLPLLI